MNESSTAQGLRGHVPLAPKRELHFRWRGNEVLFTPGDRLRADTRYAVTLVGAHDAAGNRLGEERVLELAKKVRAEAPDTIVDRLFDLVNAHADGSPLRDDLTIVVLRS